MRATYPLIKAHLQGVLSIDILQVFEMLQVIQAGHGNPQSRQASTRSYILPNPVLAVQYIPQILL